MPARSKAPLPDDVKNSALQLSLEWGEQWGKPIDERMKRAYPSLNAAAIKQLSKECNDIKSYAWRLYEDELDRLITTTGAREELLKKYPWLSTDNLNNLENQGMYYARK